MKKLSGNKKKRACHKPTNLKFEFEAMKKFETHNPFEVVENNSEDSIKDSMR